MKFLLSVILLYTLPVLSQQREIHILFDFGQHELNNKAILILDSFLINTDSSVRLRLAGHTDSVGGLEYNQSLSLKRIASVTNYLLYKGLSSRNIIEETGFGKSQPLNQNTSDADRQLNRRVELTLLSSPSTGIIAVPGKTLTEQITDTTLKAGSNIILKNLNFYGGRHLLLPESRPVMDELLNIMRLNPSLEIAIHGHICCAAGAEDGLDIDTNTFNLSLHRALEIYEYLVKNGIDASRLSYKGFGHQHPLYYPEDTEEKRSANRRVEIKIVKK